MNEQEVAYRQLTDPEVRSIRRLRARGGSLVSIRNMYGCGERHAADLCEGALRRGAGGILTDEDGAVVEDLGSPLDPIWVVVGDQVWPGIVEAVEDGHLVVSVHRPGEGKNWLHKTFNFNKFGLPRWEPSPRIEVHDDDVSTVERLIMGAMA